MQTHRFPLLVLSLAAALPSIVAAQKPAQIGETLLASLRHGRIVGQVALSPDGKRVAWTEGGRGAGQLRVSSVEDLKNGQRIADAEGCRESQPVWSPDSSSLAFLSECPGESAEILLERFNGKGPRHLSKLDGEIDAPAFSPDGSRIGFLYVPGATRPAGALAAMKAPSGVIGEEGIEIQQVATVPVLSKDASAGKEPATPEVVTPSTLHVYEFDWAPGGHELAYIAAPPPGENNWWVAKLYRQPLGGQPQRILDPETVAGPLHGLQIAVPRWSPDGRSIALIGGLMSDQGVTGGDIWLLPATGGAPVNLTPARKSTPEWITWKNPNYLWFTELAGGSTRLVGFRLAEGAANATEDRRIALPGTVGADGLELSLAANADRSQFLFRAAGYAHAPEIFALEPEVPESAPRQISHFNDDLRPAWGRAVSLDWSNEGYSVQGWLLEPLHYDPTKKYPLIVLVHGGPAAAATPRWGGGGTLSAAAFSALGYFVLEPNPRGSFGQGEAFTQANRRDFGYGDLRDILAGVDAVLANYPIDSKRIGLTGWSYGGFMAMFAVTQTNRFRATVAGAGISNWQSYYGENSIDQWMKPFFGASVYDDPGAYAKSSAIQFIQKAKTPALIVVGDRDGECPAPQSFEFWHALRAQGVPTRLVVYPDEGHGFRDPAHSRDVLERAVDWFSRYMPAAE